MHHFISREIDAKHFQGIWNLKCKIKAGVKVSGWQKNGFVFGFVTQWKLKCSTGWSSFWCFSIRQQLQSNIISNHNGSPRSFVCYFAKLHMPQRILNWISSLFFSCHSFGRICVPCTFHDGNVHKNVRTRTAQIFRVGVQSFRLHRHLWITVWNFLDIFQRRLVWFVGAACASTIAHLQSDQILVLATKFSHFIIELDEIDYFVVVPAVLVYSDFCIVGNAIVWRAIQFCRGNATYQFQHISDCTIDCVPNIDWWRLERSHVSWHRIARWQQKRNDLFTVSDELTCNAGWGY